MSQFVLITGATSGIGRRAAIDFHKKGFRVIATGRNLFELGELILHYPQIMKVELDVTSGHSIEQARKEVLRLTNGYGVDVLVNNAGYCQAGPIEDLTIGDLRNQFETNIFGLVEVTQAFLPEMRKRGSGRIINITSLMSGSVSFPFFGCYSASKVAVDAISNALRMELLPFGIKVIIIEPGATKTGFHHKVAHSLQSYEARGSVYAPFLKQADSIMTRVDSGSTSMGHVTRAMLEAATTARPKAKYLAPRRILIAKLLGSIFPTRWMDRFWWGLMIPRKKIDQILLRLIGVKKEIVLKTTRDQVS